ncbi:MAG: hypothetical protein FWG45_00845 [Oscillospiraceae bacterium]|nr:hypothetical protein [Oscillospiraceae bacterium]
MKLRKPKNVTNETKLAQENDELRAKIDELKAENKQLEKYIAKCEKKLTKINDFIDANIEHQRLLGEYLNTKRGNS